MSGSRKFLVAVFITGFLAALVACGGGGGGFTPIAYTGSTAQATLDGSNAGDFAALVENGAEMPTMAMPMAVSGGGGDASEVPAPVLQAILALGKKAPEYLEKAPAANSGAAVPAAVITETVYCGIGDGSDGSMFMSANINEVTFDMTVSVTYTDCDEGFGVVMNGGMSVSANLNDDPYVAPMTMTMSLNNLEMYFQASGETIITYAVVSMTEDLSGANPYYNMTITDLIMQDSATGLTARISNYDFTVNDYTATLGHEEITIASGAVMARVYDFDLGYVEFYTLTAILEDPVTGPFGGIVRMEGANGSWAEIDFGVTCPGGYSGSFDNGAGTTGTFCYAPPL